MMRDMSNYECGFNPVQCSIVGTICTIFGVTNMMAHLCYDQTFTFEADLLSHYLEIE